MKNQIKGSGSKSLGSFLLLMLFASMMYTACSPAGAGQGAAETNVASLIQNRRFVFVPQSANPAGARTRQVTAEFFLRVSPDTVQSYLPYFGRAYTAPITPGESGMDFMITNFDFSVAPGRKDAQIITIRPQQGTDVRPIRMMCGRPADR